MPKFSRLENQQEIAAIFRMQSKEILSLYKRHVPRYFESLASAIETEDAEKIYDHSHRLNSAMKSVEFSAVAERLQFIEQTQPDRKTLIEISQEIKLFIDQSVEVLEGL